MGRTRREGAELATGGGCVHVVGGHVGTGYVIVSRREDLVQARKKWPDLPTYSPAEIELLQEIKRRDSDDGAGVRAVALAKAVMKIDGGDDARISSIRDEQKNVLMSLKQIVARIRKEAEDGRA